MLQSWMAMESEPYVYTGQWSETVEAAEESLPAAWKIGNWSVILFSSAWAAIACLKLGRIDGARRLLDDALATPFEAVGQDFPRVYPLIALAQLHLASEDAKLALEAIRQAVDLAERGEFHLERGAAYRVLGAVYEAMGDREEADAAFQRSLEILNNIQSRPELAQTLLAYGRFKLAINSDEGESLLNRALELFEDMGATGWIDEAQAALRA